jgi:hypothetical protein
MIPKSSLGRYIVWLSNMTAYISSTVYVGIYLPLAPCTQIIDWKQKT